MPIAMSIAPGSNSHRRVYMNIMEAEEGAKGFDVWLNELSGKERLPGLKAKMFINGKEDDRRIEISGPIRRTDNEGNFVYEGKSKDGNWIDEDGNTVDTEAEAAQQYEFIKDVDGNFIWGKIATIKVINEKLDKDGKTKIPTKSTYLNAKVYTDQESHKISQIHYASTQAENDKEKEELKNQLKKEMRELGTWNNFFINDGEEFLTKLGFEVRSSQKAYEEPQP